MLQNKDKIKSKEYLKKKINKNNMLIISFFIFISIPIIIGLSLGLKREWFDVISITSIFYILLPILSMIFSLGEKGIFRKALDLFKFKEIKEMKSKSFTEAEKKQLKAFDMANEEEKKKNSDNSNVFFISITLMIYGLILLLITIPSLILS